MAAFCVQCGNQLAENRKYCSTCGAAADGAAPRRTVPAQSGKDGEALTCPSCGAAAGPLDLKCPSCGREFRNRPAAKSANDFFEQYRNAGPSERAAVIKAFPVPNAREDILTFLAMGIGNTKGLTALEEAEYRNRDGIASVLAGGSGAAALTYQKQEIAAWRAKVRQVLDTGKLLIKDNESQALFQRYEQQLKKELRKLPPAVKGLIAAVVLLIGASVSLSLLYSRVSGEKETKRLNALAAEIMLDIQKEDWNAARVKASGMRWESRYFRGSEEKAKEQALKWVQRRQELLAEIEEGRKRE